MPARLTVHHPSRPAQVTYLAEDRQTVVGRDPDCDLVMDDDRVSRRHALLAWADESWSVTDLGSKNGTSVDGLPLASGTLGERSWISFGGLLGRFETCTASPSGDQDLRRLTTALGLRRALDPGLGLRELLPRVVASTLELTGAERGFLILAGPGGELEVAARSGLAGEDLRSEEFGGSLGAVRRTLESGEPMVSADAHFDLELAARASVVTGGIRALLCVPVYALDRLLGVLYADSRRPGAVFTELDLEILQALASQAGLAIAVARLDEELKGLARRLALPVDADSELRARLAGEITVLLERSLPLARPEAFDPATWAQVQEAGTTAGGVDR
jgi:hypothetical protein